MKTMKKKINMKCDRLTSDELEGVVGGTFTANKWTKSEYQRCGISTRYNTWSKDEFFYNGRKISYEMANKIAEIANNVLMCLNTGYEDNNQITTSEVAFQRAFNSQLKIEFGSDWLWNGKKGHDC